MTATGRPTGTNPPAARAAVRPVPRAAKGGSRIVGASDPLWFKDAVIYEAHVRAFRDSDGDGIGDFVGLTSKLDYLADLGITAVWLLPFYPSPGRDDGYDIADFTAVKAEYGNLRDVRRFIDAAHRRGIRVITELVCNHTSDQHPWFQRARRAKPGTPERDFYVWSDTTDRYADARIIFTDTETSNWTWDEEARAFFWHRFFSHQPDLNFENPRVRQAIFETMDFWLEMGVDGLRLDAIPYLYEREGTDCENLPETHAFLKALRARIDARYGDRMLLAEANQWPEDSVAYFGDGDECNMCFHFPVMPRLYMALRMEDRVPILDILDQTPPIPPSSQWAMFLRNHDELTLEMVTDEERDYMYRHYAPDPRQRVNVGIRRRLAPLLDHDRQRIALLNGLLFSFPGTPVVYYGDEIGMGDDVTLGDRNGVRTPMQWDAGPNAGFSEADAASLYFPVIVSPGFHYTAVNVAAQQGDPGSLLEWMKRIIAIRKRYPVLGRGSIEFLEPDDRRVLAYIRTDGETTILVVANLSRLALHTELDLAAYAGLMPRELFGGVAFPEIGERPYFLSLGAHGFAWFELERPAGAAAMAASGPPRLADFAALTDLVDGPERDRFATALRAWATRRRWFRGKARRILSTAVVDAPPVRVGATDVLAVVLTVSYANGEPEEYLVPLVRRTAAETTGLPDEAIVLRIGDAGDTIVDALHVPDVAAGLLDGIGRRRRWRSGGRELVADRTTAYARVRGDAASPLAVSRSLGEQSNSSVILGDRVILKLYRRVEEGPNPDVEVGRFLTDHGSSDVPRVIGSLELQRPGRAAATVAMAQAFVPGAHDAWEWTLGLIDGALDAAAARRGAAPTTGAASLVDRARETPPAALVTADGPSLDLARRLGERTAALHLALADGGSDPAFAPVPAGALYQRSVYQTIRSLSRQAADMLRRHGDELPPDASSLAGRLVDLPAAVEIHTTPLLRAIHGGRRIRTHGDLHLGQILVSDDRLWFVDFEGEPGRPLSERRLKRSALVDVAGMLRSFAYVAHTAGTRRAAGAEGRTGGGPAAVDAWLRAWEAWVAAAYLGAYREAIGDASFLPPDDEGWSVLLDAFLIRKALYELEYELNNRPDWVAIPLAGIATILGA